MRKLLPFVIIALTANICFAQQKMIVHNSGNIMYGRTLTGVDSIKLDATYARLKPADSTNPFYIQKAFIDSISFTTGTITQNKIYIIYNGTENATIINPYGNQGVNITAVGGVVTVASTATIDNLEYNLLGQSNSGTLAMTTARDVNLVFNNLTLTNPTGAPISLSTTRTANIYLQSGTTTILSDGATSTKNAPITSNGPISINGTGALRLTSVVKHGINTASIITINGGTTTVLGAPSDAFHSEGFVMTAGTTIMTSLGDGIDAGNGLIDISGGTIHITSTTADVKGIKGGTKRINIANAAITINISGSASKAISAKANITINSGTINITQSGPTLLTASGSGFDPSYATAIKTDSLLTVNGGTFLINSTSTADGGRGFSAGKQILVAGGNITVTTAGNGANYTNTAGAAADYSTSAFNCDSVINIAAGTVNITNTGRNGKGLSADTLVKVYGIAQLTIGNSGKAGRAIKSDKHIIFDGGTTNLNISGDTTFTATGSGYDPDFSAGLRADTSVTFNSGSLTITAANTAFGAKGISSKKHITINGGTINITNSGIGRTYTNASGVTDSYSPAAISGDTSITITAGSVTTLSSGAAGKGLKSDGTITIGTASTTPVLDIKTTGARFLVSGSDYAHPKAIVAAKAITIASGTNLINSTDDGIHSDASITISGGTNTVNAISATSGVGEGIESPIINFTGGVTNVTASNDGINTTYGTVSGGTESNDGSQLTVSGGVLIAAESDAIDCNGNFTMTGGTVIVSGPTNQPEEGIDYNGTFLMNGGIVISGGSSAMMTQGFGAASTQRNMFLKGGTSSVVAATSMIRVQSAAGAEIVTFKPKNNNYYFHVSTPAIAASTSYQVYVGGTYSGGSFVGGTSNTWGLYQGGTWTQGSAVLKKTFTTASGTTTQNVQTF